MIDYLRIEIGAKYLKLSIRSLSNTINQNCKQENTIINNFTNVSKPWTYTKLGIQWAFNTINNNAMKKSPKYVACSRTQNIHY